MRVRTSLVVLAVSAASAVAGYACSRPFAPSANAAPVTTPTAAAQATPLAPRTLVFALTTGLEDAQTMGMVFRHAKVAAEQKKLEGVVVLVYGRGVQALDGALGARPPALVTLVRDALAAGVKVQVCANALEQFGVPRDKLEPAGVEVVPNAMVSLVDYVSRGAAVVRY